MPVKKILICVDFSDITDSVIETGRFLANLFDAEVKLLHVVEPPTPLFYEEGFEPLLTIDGVEIVVNVEKALKEEAKEKLEKYVEKFGEKANYSVEIGDIAETILEKSDEEKVDLVIIGSHQKGLIEKLLIGSITEKVVNKARTSVLVVKGEPLKEINKILVGYDFLPNSIEALEFAKDIASRAKSIIEIVHIDSDQWFAHLAHVHEEVLEKKKRLLEEVKQKIEKETGLKVEIDLEKGEVDSLLIEKIKEKNPDLVVVGKRKGKKIKRIFLGRTAMKVVRNSEKPVLIVRKREEGE